MIVPVRCFNCGKVFGHLWEEYLRLLEEIDVDGIERDKVRLVSDKPYMTPEGIAVEKLGLKRYCCRNNFISTIDLTEKI